MDKYVIFADSTCDLSTEERKKYGIEYVQMGLVRNGELEYPADLDWKAYTSKEFYDWLRHGDTIKTTQVTSQEYKNKFTPFLKKGYDIIYLACSSALSGSINTAITLVKPELLEQFPERKIAIIDSLAGSTTQGVIAVKAAEKQKEGFSFEELVEWIEKNKLKANQFATVETLKYLKNAGRIKAAKAFFGERLHVKPIFISDRKGNNFVVKQVKGTKNSLNELVEGVKATIENPGESVAWVGHCDDPETAELLKKRLIEEVGVKEVTVELIGPIVGTTCGPGMVATFCWGKEVTVAEGDEE